MILIKIISIISTMLLFAPIAMGQSYSEKEDIYNENKVFIYNTNGDAIGYFLNN